MTYSHILYAVTDGVAHVRLNDPATLNSISRAMGHELRDAVDRAGGEARAVLLSGEGRGFSSGANLTDGSIDVGDPQRDIGERLEAVYNPLMRAIRDCPRPVVSAVRGAAAGVGCSLALAADLVVAAEDAYFLMAFARIGLVPDGGSTWLLARGVGRVRAMEMMLLGEKLPAPKALEWGLVNRVVPEAEVDGAAHALARRLADGPAALGHTRRIAWAADAGFEAALDAERAAQRDAGRTADFAEGVAAFLAKRPARFAGR